MIERTGGREARYTDDPDKRGEAENGRRMVSGEGDTEAAAVEIQGARAACAPVGDRVPG